MWCEELKVGRGRGRETIGVIEKPWIFFIDITDPSLVWIDDGVMVSEGALVQSHEVKNGNLSFLPVRIGRNACVGPYAVIQKGSILGEEAEVLPLQKTEGGKPLLGKDKSYTLQKGKIMTELTVETQEKPEALYHFFGIYHLEGFHWFPVTIVAYATMISSVPSSLVSLYQTEAFCMYLRLLGAKVGRHCSIRAINPVTDPELISIGDGVHLGDFSRIIAGFYSSSGCFNHQKVEVQDNSVVGSQSLILPGSVIQKDVILGALSVAPVNLVLQRGGVYVGSQTPIMVKNTLHTLDERIEKMDTKYKKIVGNLAGNLAVTTMKVKSRYFHRIGVAGKGSLKMFDDVPGIPEHTIFHAGKTYPVIIRHSNSLSADDDARIDARGAALPILHSTEDDDDSSNNSSPLLDLTLKTGKAFYARTIADFATWLVCGLAAREEVISNEEDSEFVEQLKILNKHPIKSIQDEEGDIFDCIQRDKQPAFDHPLLKNHKIIQMEPTSLLKSSLPKNSLSAECIVTLKRIECPKGTVPIRRTLKEDLIRAKLFMEEHAAGIHPSTPSYPNQHVSNKL
ncbi:hypothetical protein IFM89_005658 [Coptis chinensis]|uniref:Neprosin activation peptide domain-containing protein n=1 Tax=Coptis chinensis TaxID=261450 RepID=A0A835LA57_9MAGN|nr:hypothetical protein IFM89_005658 [Coptis chinensis]